MEKVSILYREKKTFRRRVKNVKFKVWKVNPSEIYEVGKFAKFAKFKKVKNS